MVRKRKYFESRLPDIGRSYEDLIHKFADCLVVPGATVFDGGCNSGMHTIPLAKRLQGKGLVYAVDPIQRMIEENQKWAEYDGDDRVISYHIGALWHKNGSAILNVCEEPAFSSLRFISEGKKYSEIEVSQIRIDDIVASDRDLTFLKLDCEGAEYNALCGGREVIRRSDVFIVFENALGWAAERFEYSKEDFFALFEDLDLDLFDAFGDRFGSANWDDPDVGWYFFAIKRDTRCSLDLPGLARKFWDDLESGIRKSNAAGVD